MSLATLSFGLDAPWWLLLLGVLPVLAWSAKRSLSGLGAARRRTVLALRFLVVVFLILALAELRILRWNERLSVIFVVDRSESIPAEKREAARQYIVEEAARRTAGGKDLVGVVAFGRAAGIEVIPGESTLELDSFTTLIEPEATNLAGALRLAAAAFPAGTSRRVVLVSDGNENVDSALEEVHALKSQGITVDTVPIGYSYPAEIAVDKLLVDPEVNLAQAFTVRAVVEATRATEAYLRLFEDDTLVTDAGSVVKLKAGKNVFDFQRRFDTSGKHEFELRVEPVNPQDDSLLLNNSASSFTFIHGEPSVLLATEEPELEAPLLAALASERIKVKIVSPDAMPLAAEDYFEHQAIILSNAAAFQLGDDRMKLLEALVRTVGVGLVMIGGENSFGPGGFQGTPIERALPVEMEIKQRKTLPNGALAMVVHSCELTNGNYWANQVVQRAIQTLSPRDYAGVLYFDNSGQDRWLFGGGLLPCTQKQQMFAALRTFDPGDMPSFDGIVRMAHAGLSRTPASIKHMVILTDGDPSLPGPDIIQQIKDSRITISAICYGAHGGVPTQLRGLAAECGGKFHILQGPRNLPELFLREAATVQRSLIYEEEFQPVLGQRGSLLVGFGSEGLPPLGGYVLTTPRELATIHLLHPPRPDDPAQDPVLASWTYGLGRAVAFTSDAGRRWGKAWAAWQGYQQFWVQLVRWVSRRQGDDHFRLTRSVDGERGTVTIDAVSADGKFLNGLKIEGKVTGPSQEVSSANVRQVSPGRYVAEFPATNKGTYTVALAYELGEAARTAVTGVTVPSSPEFRKLETSYELLRKLAEAGGGQCYMSPEDADFFRRDFERTNDVQPVWLELVIAALVLFFADVFLRRVVINYGLALAGLGARVRSRLRRKAAAPTPAEARLATLLERKAQLRESVQGKSVDTPAPGAGGVPADVRRGATSTLTDAAATLAEADTRGSGAARRSEPPPRVEEKKKPDEATYTSRLLEAKRRALGKENKDPDKKS